MPAAGGDTAAAAMILEDEIDLGDNQPPPHHLESPPPPDNALTGKTGSPKKITGPEPETCSSNTENTPAKKKKGNIVSKNKLTVKKGLETVAKNKIVGKIRNKTPKRTSLATTPKNSQETVPTPKTAGKSKVSVPKKNSPVTTPKKSQELAAAPKAVGKTKSKTPQKTSPASTEKNSTSPSDSKNLLDIKDDLKVLKKKSPPKLEKWTTSPGKTGSATPNQAKITVKSKLGKKTLTSPSPKGLKKKIDAAPLKKSARRLSKQNEEETLGKITNISSIDPATDDLATVDAINVTSPFKKPMIAAGSLERRESTESQASTDSTSRSTRRRRESTESIDSLTRSGRREGSVDSQRGRRRHSSSSSDTSTRSRNLDISFQTFLFMGDRRQYRAV